MAVIKRGSVTAPPEPARQVVTVEALGGDVIVTELMLDGRLDFEATLRDSKRTSVHAMVPHLLAVAVVLEDGEPLYSVQQWRSFGAKNRDVTIDLFNVAMRLSGFDGANNAKN